MRVVFEELLLGGLTLELHGQRGYLLLEFCVGFLQAVQLVEAGL